MILKSNNHEVEIRIRNFELPNCTSDMDYLRIQLRVASKKASWQVTDPCLTPREAIALSKWMRKFASKKHPYGDSIKFSEPSLSFKAIILKNGIKRVVIGFNAECKPPFIKNNDPYLISIELTDKELKQAAYDLKKEIPPCTKMNLPGIIKMDAEAIRKLVAENSPDTIRYAEGIKMKTSAPANGNTNEIRIIVKHTDGNQKCNDDNLFWAPFIGEMFKSIRGKEKLLTPEFYEKALKNNFCTLLTGRLTEHFKKAFFDIDAQYKNSQESGVRSSEKEENRQELGAGSPVKKESGQVLGGYSAQSVPVIPRQTVPL